MAIRERTDGSREVRTTRFEIERERPIRAFFLGSGIPKDQPESQGILREKCLHVDGNGEYLARGCGLAPVLFGPYVEVEPGARVELRIDVEARKGPFKLQADLVSGRGSVEHDKTKVRSFPRDDSRGSLGLAYRMKEGANDLEARLSLVDGDKESSFVVRRLILEIVP
jgi:hypothetical protein